MPGHELGHALDIASSSANARLNQALAIHIENSVARELDPKAPLRHPTMNHGGGWLGR